MDPVPPSYQPDWAANPPQSPMPPHQQQQPQPPSAHFYSNPTPQSGNQSYSQYNNSSNIQFQRSLIDDSPVPAVPPPQTNQPSFEKFGMPPHQQQAPAPITAPPEDPYGMPPGWEARPDGKGDLFFLDHQSKISTYSDPRIGGPMPQGWSIRADQQGNLYYVDHIEKRSHWTDPRTPLPPGWELKRDPSGKKYYVNHVLKTSQFEDPRKSASQAIPVSHATPVGTMVPGQMPAPTFIPPRYY